MTTTYTHVAGIDPSLTGTGVAADDGSWFTITPRSKGDERLLEIRNRLRYALVDIGYAAGGRADLVVMEDVPPVRGQALAKLGMVQGVIRAELMSLKIPYALVTPAGLKLYATGKGSGAGTDKHGMRMAAYKRAGVEFPDDNQCDAWWARQLGLYAVGHPDAIEMPQRNREAALKLAWPDDITRRLLHPYEQLVPIEEATA